MKKNILLGCIIGVLAIALALAAVREMPALRARFRLLPALPPGHTHAVAQVDAAPPASTPSPSTLGSSTLGSSTLAPSPMVASSRRAPLPAPLAVSNPEALPRLSGILIMGAARQAIFESSDTTQAYGVGDRIGAYRILDIDRVSVTVEGPGGTQILRPDGDGGAVPAASSRSQANSLPPSLLDQLNTQPPPVVAVPRPPSLTQMLSHLPKGH